MDEEKDQNKNDNDVSEDQTGQDDNSIAESEEEPEEIEPVHHMSDDTGEVHEAENIDSIPDEVIEEEIKSEFGLLKPRSLIEEMQVSYLDYAMSVIVSRALPDVRDGLKPVHRRVLYAMYSTGLRHNVKYRKSAKVVGEVLGNFHPHGDLAVYDSLVRLAQDFSMRYPMIDGQGNFGSMDGDSAAAMRYTECRMSAIAEEMLLDIDKDTVNWQDNYDGSTQEPMVLPARIPQLLLNGSMGIAVGMATNIPPHNLGELCDGVIHLIDNSEATVDDLMEFIKGPDFPTGGNIYNIEDIKTAYATGKGRIMMRAKAEIEEAKRGFRIVITEIPYQVNKATLIEKIAELVKLKKIDGISDLRDESDRRGVRVVVELKGSAYPNKVLNRLFELTSMQTAFHVNLLALTPDLEPRVMSLKDVLGYYIEHRKEVITRRSEYELNRAKDRAHILEGLKIALDNIDEVIKTIKESETRDAAKINLIKRFELSEKQADAILDMRLSALAALERKRIEDELAEIMKRIAHLEDILAHPEKILGLIKDDLSEVKEKYGDGRRTVVVPHALGSFSAEDLIPNEQVIVSLSRGNYIKRQEVGTYRKQVRGGVGVVGMTTKEEDIVDYLVCSYTHDDIYFFTNQGRVFKSKVYELPATSRQSKGTPVVNIIQLGPTEKVTSILTVPQVKDGMKFFVMGTKNGQIKRTEIEKYDNIRKTGIVAIGLKSGDELKWVKATSGNDTIVEVSEKGLAICYNETDARPMGRSASGVTGVRLKASDNVMSMDVIHSKFAGIFDETITKYTGPDMLIVLENGFGKRTMLKHFHLQKRGGMGIKAANCTPKTGNVIGMHITYSDEGDVVLASNKGQFIRMALKDIKRLGRDTQGVTLMRLKGGDKVASVALILPNDEDEGDSSQLPLDNGKPPKLDIKPQEETKSSDESKNNSSKEVANSQSVEKRAAEKDEKNDPAAELKIKSYKEPKVPETKSTKQPEEKSNSSKTIIPEIHNYKETAEVKVREEKNEEKSVEAGFTIKKVPSIKKDDEPNYWGKQKGLYN
ncbi:MAG: DNA gyrase subunit A [Patescibacteria group bacterium]|jgi:DNA gyrase subunit A